LYLLFLEVHHNCLVNIIESCKDYAVLVIKVMDYESASIKMQSPSRKDTNHSFYDSALEKPVELHIFLRYFFILSILRTVCEIAMDRDLIGRNNILLLAAGECNTNF
jgi:hypothetical protein